MVTGSESGVGLHLCWTDFLKLCIECKITSDLHEIRDFLHFKKAKVIGKNRSIYGNKIYIRQKKNKNLIVHLFYCQSDDS